MIQDFKEKENYTIGVISDTHGLVRPQVSIVFQDADVILHAGDIGGLSVLHELGSIAPVIAVRGNMDHGSWAHTLPKTELAEIGRTFLYLIHDINVLDLNPSASGVHAVIYGHTHKPLLEKENGVVYLNPGSAGPGSSRPTVAVVNVKGESVNAAVVKLV